MLKSLDFFCNNIYNECMRKKQFEKIINLLQPQMDKVEFGKSYYRAYLYVVRFFWNDEEYILRMYMLENTAEILKVHSHKNVHGTIIEKWEHIISEDEVSEELRQKIVEIQSE